MLRSTQIMIRLAAVVPLATASRPALGAVPAGDFQMHTNQGDLIRHTNQESRWRELFGRPLPGTAPGIAPVTAPDRWSDPSSVVTADPWEHGNAPRMTAPAIHNLPGPGTMAVLGLAWLCAPARRRR